MTGKHEKPLAIKAGILSILVHGGLLLMLVFSVNFKSTPPVSYSKVELWDTLPNKTSVQPAILPEIEEKIIEPKPEPIVKKSVVKEQKIPDIQIKQEVKKPKIEPVKPDKIKLEKSKKDPIKELQAIMAAEDKTAQLNITKKTEKTLNQARVSAANQGDIDKYKVLISEKIKDKVNKELCNIGNKKVTVKISMMATGEVLGAPRVTISSGSEACDRGVESAVLLAQPLPLPQDKELFSHFRDLTLNFRLDE